MLGETYLAGQVIYGARSVAEALRAGGRVNRVYFARESRPRDCAALVEAARAGGVPFDFVPQAKLNELADTQEHQGVVAQISPIAYASLEDCLAACPPTALLLALDQVQHPRNVGMMARTALGAGASGLLLTARGGALIDDTVLRASAGAVFHLPIVSCGNMAQALREMKEAGFWAYGLDAAGDMDVFRTPWAQRAVLVLGNETEGLRPGVRKACDAFVSIPLAGGLDSLNVAVAAGVALFQAAHAQREKERRKPF